MASEPTGGPQRLRLTYRHGEQLRFVSHLDLIRVFERALRRAGLPIAYSEGFNPRPRITCGAPLPVAFTGEQEVADFLLSVPMELDEFRRRLAAQLPAGLELSAVEEVPRSLPSLPAILRAARYRASLPASIPIEEVEQAVVSFLEREELERPARGRRQGSYDLRGLVIELGAHADAGGPALEMLLRAEPGATGRPEEVLDALGYGHVPAHVARLTLDFGPSRGRDEAGSGHDLGASA